MQKVYGIIEKIADIFNIMHTKWSSSRCFHQQHLKDCKNPNGTEFIMTTALAAPLAYNSNIAYDQILPTINVNLRSRNWTAYVDTGATVNLVTQSLVMYLDLPKTKISRQSKSRGWGRGSTTDFQIYDYNIYSRNKLSVSYRKRHWRRHPTCNNALDRMVGKFLSLSAKLPSWVFGYRYTGRPSWLLQDPGL